MGDEVVVEDTGSRRCQWPSSGLAHRVTRGNGTEVPVAVPSARAPMVQSFVIPKSHLNLLESHLLQYG